MVMRALRPFALHRDISHVALVLPPDDAANPPDFLATLLEQFPDSAIHIVPGGDHRGDSVRAGLAALPGECLVVLVHDAARPFADKAVIEAVIDVARRGEAAVPALPLSDTLKEATPSDPTRIARTCPRAHLWRAQTPQGFPRAVLEEAHAPAATVDTGPLTMLRWSSRSAFRCG